jgi:poly(3-hydroxybutyrate) depolymerase
MKRFDQSAYTRPYDASALSMGDTGYVFVPKDCEEGGTCRVHIALHGCRQDADHLDRRFIDDTGYNAWADTNHLIVLYPQTRPGSFFVLNPEACWDWWSYIDHGDSYVSKSGSQIQTIKAMLDALTMQSSPATIVAAVQALAPNGIAVIDTSDTAADVVWSPIAGATTYRVWRASTDGLFAAIGDIAGSSFGDIGLAPKTTYRWRVSAIVNAVEGPPSTEASATTRLKPPRCDNPGTCPIDN